MPNKHGNPRMVLKQSETKQDLLEQDVDPESAEISDFGSKTAETKQLTLCRKILFGLAAPPLQMTGNICGFFFSLFLLEVVRMSPLLVSVITFVGRAWDGITDPLVGQLVFRTKTRFGRTKPWLIGATVMGPLTFFLMWFYPPGLKTSMQMFFYYFICYLAYCTAITCYHVPYTSSTVLISSHAKDKDGATAARIAFDLVFTIIGSLVFGVIICKNRVTYCSNSTLTEAGWNNTNVSSTPLSLSLEDQDRVALERNGYMLAAGIIALIYFVCGIFAICGIKERVKIHREAVSFFKNISNVLSFRPYQLLMSAFLFMSLGIQIVQANLGLYTTHSMKLGDQMQYGIFTVLSVAVLCVPFWYKMANRFGKRRVFIGGLLPMFPCLITATFMPAKCLICYYAVCAVSGLSISVAMLLPWSMLPDVIDQFYRQHNDRKESVFYSLYVFFTKFASGISLALSQVALAASGYNSDSSACQQPDSVGQALRYLVGPGPIVCLLVSIILMWFYPIDEYKHRGSGQQTEIQLDGETKDAGIAAYSDSTSETAATAASPAAATAAAAAAEPPVDFLTPSMENGDRQGGQGKTTETDTQSSGSDKSNGSGDSGYEGGVSEITSTTCLIPAS